MTILKIILTLVILLAAFLLFILIWTPEQKEVNNPLKLLTNIKPCFEVKILGDGGDYYEVFFTNNDWATQEDLLVLEDFTVQSGYISVNTWNSIKEKDAATKFAQKFTTYEQCVEHNEIVLAEVKRLKAYYRAQGMMWFSEYQKHQEQKEKSAKKEPEEIIINSCNGKE